MLKQQHYTLTNVKKVKSQSTTPLTNTMFSSWNNSFRSHLRWPNARIHRVPVPSLWASTLRPLRFLARTRSPTSAWARPVSTSALALSSSSSSRSAPSSPAAALRFPHTICALCSASGSPAAWKSRRSCRRFTPWKMLAVPDLRFRRSEPGGRENVGWDGPGRAGAEATSSICGTRGEGHKVKRYIALLRSNFYKLEVRNFLSRPLSFLGWTTAMLFWLVFQQTQSNLYKWFRMQRHDWSSMSPKEPMLHLSSSHCTGYQWQLASSSRHWCLHTERPQAQHPPTSTHYYESTSPPEVWDLLVSDALWYHHREAQNHSPEHSHSPFLDGGIIFPPLSGMLDPCQSSSNNWKLISFGTTWLHPKLVLKKKKTFPLSFSPSLASSYLFEQWLRLGVTSTSSVWLPLQDESLYVFPNCKSLWIKASAKWLNVNVNVKLFQISSFLQLLKKNFRLGFLKPT